MGQIDSQEKVFALLADPATHGGAAVRRIDTPAASVFLAGERAYKVKRAVRSPFLDYGTLAKRKAACEAELAVNRPFASEIYLRVVPITRDDARLSLGGSGEPIEWAVEMRRFDEDATLDHLAARGQIEPSLADALARTIAAAHAKGLVVNAGPWIEALERFIEQNGAAFRESPDLFSAIDADALITASHASLDRIRPLLHARGTQGLVRSGHGDLHLGNIALVGGRPVLFDAIEFDPLIAAGDVLYDLAFLLMDLTERGLTKAASVVFNRYLAEARRDSDLDALAALPLFMSLRAGIRAKVTAALLENADATERPTIAQAAATYFRLAAQLIAPPSPLLIAVGGLSGTGKSMLARELAADFLPAPGAVLLRSDVERKVMFGVPETERLPVEAYNAASTRSVYTTLAAKARRVNQAGHSAIVDAVFATDEERARIATASASHWRFRGLFLTADLATRRARVEARRGDASDADVHVAHRQESYELGALDWTRVDASGTPEDTLRNARAALAQ